MRDVEGKGTRVEAKQTEMLLNFEKERAKWEHEKNYIMSLKDDATEKAERLDKKVEYLTRENEKLRNEIKTNRKNMYQAATTTSSLYGAKVGSQLLGNIQNYQAGAFKAGVTGKDGVSALDSQRMGLLKENSLGSTNG